MNLESSILQNIRLALPPGVVMFRNQIGAYKKDDYYIEYGVGGKGGSDLIGFSPVKITTRHIGRTLSVFTAIEVKTATGRISDAQQNFIDVIRRSGGIAGIARSPSEAKEIIHGF